MRIIHQITHGPAMGRTRMRKLEWCLNGLMLWSVEWLPVCRSVGLHGLWDWAGTNTTTGGAQRREHAAPFAIAAVVR